MLRAMPRSTIPLFLLLAACGGASPSPVIAPPVVPSPDAGVAEPIAPGVSVVRFDDLGLSFAVPPGLRVLGDDDLAARVRASANPRLTAALQGRASQKKALPLLTLSKDSLSVTLSVMLVPKDATATELVAQQRAVMSENLERFEVGAEPRERSVDGVAGSELVSRYLVRNVKMAAALRIFVREGLAVLVIAAAPDGSPLVEEGRGLLDGLRFYAPATSTTQ